MNTIQRTIFVGTLVCGVAFLACKKDDPVDPCNNFSLSAALQAESNAVISAATIFGQNPTTENCNSYRSAYQAYLNAAAGYQSCANATGQGAEYQQAIADAQAELQALQC